MSDDIAEKIRLLWTQHKIGSSRKPAMRLFVTDLISLVADCEDLLGKSGEGAIEFVVGAKNSVLQMPARSPKPQLRTMIANISAFASIHRNRPLNPYGDRTAIAIVDRRGATQSIAIDYSNTIRNPYFRLQLLKKS